MEHDISVIYHRRFYCDAPDCGEWPSAEVRYVFDDGSMSSHHQVCRQHVYWSKKALRDLYGPESSAALALGAM